MLIKGKSIRKIGKSGLGAELLLRQCVDFADQKIGNMREAKTIGDPAAQESRLVVASLFVFDTVYGDRDYRVDFPGTKKRPVPPQDLIREKVGQNPLVMVFETDHGRLGHPVINKQRTAAKKTFGENSAVIAVFLSGIRDGLSAAVTGAGSYKGKLPVTGRTDGPPKRDRRLAYRAP